MCGGEMKRKSCRTCSDFWWCLESDREYACRSYKKKVRKRDERGKKHRVYESAQPAQPDDPDAGSGAAAEGQASASDGRGGGSDVGDCGDCDRGALGTALGGGEDGKRN